MSTSQNLTVTWTNVPTRTITAGGLEFAYRELGTNNPGTPVVFLSGAPATSIEQMATDAVTFIKVMGFERVDLFGFSLLVSGCCSTDHPATHLPLLVVGAPWRRGADLARRRFGLTAWFMMVVMNSIYDDHHV